MPDLLVRRESWPIRGSFRISRGAKTSAEVVVVELRDGPGDDALLGRGECLPYGRYGETPESVMVQIANLKDDLAQGMDRQALQGALAPGAARNAMDCALWDLEAKRAGKRAWQLADLQAPDPLVTAYTLSVDEPDAMAKAATENAWRPLLKIKLAGGPF
jgi:L-alanine-DL-glutamate epimerase-like enolase superfamily enzyme